MRGRSFRLRMRQKRATNGAGGSAGSTNGVGGSAGSTLGDAATTSDASTPRVGDTDAKGRKLVWADEFDGPNIDRAGWGNETGLIRNNELETYTADGKNQFIENGNLVIKGIYDGGTGRG